MAIAPSPKSKATVSTSIDNKRKVVSRGGEAEETKSQMNPSNPSSQPPKRNKNPGVRVIRGRIYDSQNGTTCHQCRQKTYAVYVSCKNPAKTKPCPLKYCRTCLLNRYGEKTEDVVLLDVWSCPKCRGACNCSICMKKRGHLPTGMLSPMAKAGGFSSVSDMIDAKGAQNVSNYKRVKETTASPRKPVAPAEGIKITSPMKLGKETAASPKKTAVPTEGIKITSPKGKENLFDGKTDSNANPPLSVSSPIEHKPKKIKRKGLEEVMHAGSGVSEVSVTKVNGTLNKKKQKKSKSEGLKDIVGGNVDNGAVPKVNGVQQKKLKSERSKDIVGGNVNSSAILKVNGVQKAKKETKTSIHVGTKTEEDKNINKDGEVLDGRFDKKTDQHEKDNKQCFKVKRNNPDSCNKSHEAVIPLPTGTDLVTIAGVDLPKEAAGNALQLLEFCATFAKILDVKKGQAEAVLRELIKGRSTRRGKFTSVIQFHIQLLCFIQGESESESESESSKLELTHGNNSWLKALKNCISKSQNLSKYIDCVDKTPGGYDNLDSSMKLRLLIFLCDEVLGTEKIRNWIDDQNAKFAEKRKEAKDKLSAAKEKEKSLKQTMQDDIAKAIIAKEGVPLTLKEHDDIVSKIKSKAAEAHAEILECRKMVHIDKERPDAMRIEPIFKENDGHVYWRLKGYSEKPSILLQDIGTGDHTVEAVDKWFQFDDEQMDMIEKHIHLLRSRFGKGYKKPVY